MVSEPTVDDVLWLLDNNYGTDYGDVVRTLIKNQKPAPKRTIYTVTIKRPKGWVAPPPHSGVGGWPSRFHYKGPNDRPSWMQKFMDGTANQIVRETPTFTRYYDWQIIAEDLGLIVKVAYRTEVMK